jgi:uracil-DNA glycosylase family 4
MRLCSTVLRFRKQDFYSQKQGSGPILTQVGDNNAGIEKPVHRRSPKMRGVMGRKRPSNAAWRELLHDAQHCTLCPRMSCSKRVLSDLNGPSDASIMFVAEAPGRLGAERTGIPLFGDRTGDRFEGLMAAMRWQRCDVFITNAVLCNPRDEAGNNDAPDPTEIENCSTHLKRTICLVDPVLIVALGAVALRALSLIEQHSLRLRDSVGGLTPWFGRQLGVLYHPGPRSAVHRPWEVQLKDARRLAAASQSNGITNTRSRHFGATKE